LLGGPLPWARMRQERRHQTRTRPSPRVPRAKTSTRGAAGRLHSS
jgi:hypothetical protein